MLLALELLEVLTRRGLDCVQNSKTNNVTSELKSLFIFQWYQKIFRPNQHFQIFRRHFKTLALLKNQQYKIVIECNCNPKHLLVWKKRLELLPDLPSLYWRVFVLRD